MVASLRTFSVANEECILVCLIIILHSTFFILHFLLLTLHAEKEAYSSSIAKTQKLRNSKT